jgi:hypothetical protein
MMIPPNHVQFDNKSFPLEQATFYGIYERYGDVSWWVELFPKDDDNYIMFNSLVFNSIILPNQFSFFEPAAIGDKYEHTVQVNGMDRFLENANLIFGAWDARTQSIPLAGHGTILEEKKEGIPKVQYQFNANLTFTGIHLYETTKDETQKFIDTHLTGKVDITFQVKFEEAPSGLAATITGKF